MTAPRPGRAAARPRAAPPGRVVAAGRRAAIVQAAAAFFADAGFKGTTRALAARLGVTQALLYRYFRRKDELIAAAMAEAFDRGPAPVLAAGDAADLEARLGAFYAAYVARMTPVGLRLWMRANLDGQPLAGRHGGPLTRRVLAPVVAALRQAAGLPGLARRPMLRGERELAMALHGGIVFLAIRRHVYRMALPDDLSPLVVLQVRAALPGLLAEVARLHAPGADPALTVPVVSRRETDP